MQDLLEKAARHFEAIEESLTAERMDQAAYVVHSAIPRVERAGLEKWNGSTAQWTVFVSVGAVNYVQATMCEAER